MKELESKLTDIIIASVDVKAAAKNATEYILESKEFGDKFEERMLSYNGYTDSLIHRVHCACVDKLAEKYIEKHGNEILSAIDPEAIASGMMFNAITKTKMKLDGQ